jgi:hypothetical protein
MLHDKAYDLIPGANGAAGLKMMETLPANQDLVSRCKQVMNLQ